MIKHTKKNITRKLLTGFIAVNTIFCFYGIISLIEMNKLSALTRKLYDHPLVVSNASLQANVGIIKMYSSMKDVSLLGSQLAINTAIDAVIVQEGFVLKNLDVVRNNILGEEGKSLEKKTRQIFTNWKPIREEVIKLVFNDQREEAAIITMGKGADHVRKLESIVLELSSYAINKAGGFMKHADLARSRVERNTIILILIGIFLSIIVAFITVRKVLAVEDVLLESEKKYQDLYDNAPDMFASVDVKTATIVNCNQTLADQLGYTKEEIVGRPIFDMYTRDSAEYSKEKVFPVFVRKGTIEGEEMHLQRKDGSTLCVSLNVSAIRNEKGDIIHSRSIWRDITERKQAEEEHINRVKLQAVLETAGAACHELNQPLHTISGYSELLSMGIPEKNPIYGKVRKIREQIDRMGEITAKLMGITRYETKAYSGEKNIIDLDNVRERRKYKRFVPRGRAFIMPKSDSPKQHQIIDLSMGGLAFWCNEIHDQLDEFDKWSINMADGNFNLDNIPCKAISNLTIADDSPLGSVSIKRCGVQFGDLNTNQTDQLEYFIKNHTIAG